MIRFVPRVAQPGTADHRRAATTQPVVRLRNPCRLLIDAPHTVRPWDGSGSVC